MKPTLTLAACACAVVVLALVTTTYAQYTSTPTMTLVQNTSPKEAAPPAEKAKAEKTEESTPASGTGHENWDIIGPIRLRSAEPADPGELDLKFTTEWGTSSDGKHDRASIEPEIEC